MRRERSLRGQGASSARGGGREWRATSGAILTWTANVVTLPSPCSRRSLAAGTALSLRSAAGGSDAPRAPALPRAWAAGAARGTECGPGTRLARVSAAEKMAGT